MRPIVFCARLWMRRNRAAVAGLVLAIALVGGLMLSLAGGYVRTATVADRYVSSRPVAYDLSVSTDGGSPWDDGLERLPAIERIDLATFVFGGLIGPDGQLIDSLLFAGSPAPIGGSLIAGRLPRSAEELVATDVFVEQAGVAIGDALTLLTLTPEQATAPSFEGIEPAGPTVEATLVGVLDPGPTGLQDPTAVAVFDPSLLDLEDLGTSGSEGLVDLAPGATAADLREQLGAGEAGAPFAVSEAEVVPGEVRAAVRVQAQALGVLAGIVTVAGAALLLQLLTRLARSPAGDRAVLRSVGFGPLQLVFAPVARVALPVLGGGLGALAVAVAASARFPVGYAEPVDPHDGLRFDLAAHLGGSVLLVAVLLGGTGLLLYRDPSARPLRRSALAARSGWLRNPTASTAVSISFGRVRGHGVDRRSLASVAVIVGILIGALSLGASLDRLLDEPARYGYRYDVETGSGGGEVPAEAVAALEEDPAIESVVLFGASTVSVGDRPLSVIGMRPVRGDALPEALSGRRPRRDDEIALGRRAADDLAVDLGDRVDLGRGADASAFEVTGIVLLPNVDQADVPGRSGLVTEAGLLRVDPEEVMSLAAIDGVPGTSPDAVTAAAERAGLDAQPTQPPSEAVNLDRVRVVPFLVALIVALLVALSAGHLVVATVRRQHRDLAILRAVGADPGWVRRVVQWEAALVAVLASVSGLLLGVVIANLTFRFYADRLGARPDLLVPWTWLAASCLAIVVVAEVAALLSTPRARHPVADLLGRSG